MNQFLTEMTARQHHTDKLRAASLRQLRRSIRKAQKAVAS